MNLKPKNLIRRMIYLKDADEEIYTFVVSMSCLLGILMGVLIVIMLNN